MIKLTHFFLYGAGKDKVWSWNHGR